MFRNREIIICAYICDTHIKLILHICDVGFLYLYIYFRILSGFVVLKVLRQVFLFEKELIIAKKRDDGGMMVKTYIVVSRGLCCILFIFQII